MRRLKRGNFRVKLSEAGCRLWVLLNASVAINGRAFRVALCELKDPTVLAAIAAIVGFCLNHCCHVFYLQLGASSWLSHNYGYRFSFRPLKACAKVLAEILLGAFRAWVASGEPSVIAPAAKVFKSDSDGANPLHGCKLSYVAAHCALLGLRCLCHVDLQLSLVEP
jgi:hypothetical protein